MTLPLLQLAAASLQLLLLFIIAVVVVVVAFGNAAMSVIVGSSVAAEVSARCFVVVVSFFDESLSRMISVLAGLAFDAVAAAAATAAVLIGGVNIVVGDVAVATVEIPAAIPEVATALLIGGVNIVLGSIGAAMNEAARSIVEVKVGAGSVRWL